MKIRKKIICVILTLCMVLSLLPCTVFATTEENSLTAISENEEVIESDTKSAVENTSEEIIEQTATDPEAPMASSYQEFTEQNTKSDETERKMADFVFIIDSTGSMDSYIRSVRSNLTAFVEYLASQNIDLRMSLIDYKDIIADGVDSTVIHTFDGSKWTSDVNTVKNELADVNTGGGGDLSETPTDALNKIIADDWRWRSDSSKFAFLLTDALFKSTDYVTGRRWGDLSGGNQIDYSDNFELGSNYQNWNSSAKNNFERSRWNVFRYCTFVNRYNGGINTGIAEGIPGQFFIVACMTGMNNTAVAGTFMHELGHTLGLKHGGDEHTGYKANYLSIMNYLFQLSGLLGVNGTEAVNYSDYVLPALDETNLDENRGVDPEGKTAGRNLGTRWLLNGSECSVDNIANQPIDYNQNGIIETSLNLNINGNSDYDPHRGYITGTTQFAESINDCSNLTYRGGLIGGQGVSTSSDTLINREDTDDYMQHELTIDEALKLNILGNQGACAIADILPETLYADIENQTIKVTVNNLDSSVSKPTLIVNSKIIGGKISKTISLPATSGKISNTVVEIPVVANVSKGEYSIECELKCKNGDTDTKEATVDVIDAKTVKVTTGKKVDLLQGTSLDGVTFKWEISDPTIAEINDGIVSGKKVGNAIVYGYTNDDDMVVCKIKVTSPQKVQLLKLGTVNK